MILALDLGTRTGWATNPNGQVVTGFVDFKGGRYEGGGMRYLRFMRWLEGLERPTEVHFEEVRRHRGTDAAHVYGGLLATLTSWCESHDIPYRGVPVSAIKRAATGKGGGPGTKKEHMIAAAQAAGQQITDDNEADAYWLLRYVLSEREQEVFS